MDDAIRLGLAYHSWPFAEPVASLAAVDRAYILERTLAVMPPPPKQQEDVDG